MRICWILHVPLSAFVFVSMHVILFMFAYICVRFKLTIIVVSLILMYLFVLGIHPWIMMTMIFKTRISI